jgi:hypothetical protein
VVAGERTHSGGTLLGGVIGCAIGWGALTVIGTRRRTGNDPLWGCLIGGFIGGSVGGAINSRPWLEGERDPGPMPP